MPELFDILTLDTAKVNAVDITATSDASPQTVISLTTPTLEDGFYMVGYSFQVTHGAKNQPLYFRVGGTLEDAAFFSNTAGDNDELHKNRAYFYPKQLSGSVLLTLEMYKPTGSTTIDFADVFVSRAT